MKETLNLKIYHNDCKKNKVKSCRRLLQIECHLYLSVSTIQWVLSFLQLCFRCDDRFLFNFDIEWMVIDADDSKLEVYIF